MYVKCELLNHVFPTTFVLSILKKIMVWNCCGAASKSFSLTVKDLTHLHKPDLLGLLETKISGG